MNRLVRGRWCSALRLGLWTCLLLPDLLSARIISVGPQGEFQHIAQAAESAQDGDIVEISAGVYSADVAVWRQKRLTLQGVGGRPVLIAAGHSAEAKAIWVLKHGDFTIRNIEFRGSRVPDGNGAGIRFERGRLQVRDCVFEDNQNGILTGNYADSELSIEDSTFALAPHQSDPLPHLLYVGQIASVRIQGSRFQRGYLGHLVKSRARRSELRYNLIHDGRQGQASYELDFPNGGWVTLVGNIIEHGAGSANPALIAYGAEGHVWPQNRLEMAHNTLINDGWLPAWFVRTWASSFPAGFEFNSYNNLWVGLGFFSSGLEGRSVGNARTWAGALHEPAALDFRLSGSSGLRQRSVVPDEALLPAAEFMLPVGVRPIPGPRTWAPGAVQTAAPP
nr:right-handed parallel beta-helix repeat-containing protein [uncultured Roseateles sp.]